MENDKQKDADQNVTRACGSRTAAVLDALAESPRAAVQDAKDVLYESVSEKNNKVRYGGSTSNYKKG